MDEHLKRKINNLMAEGVRNVPEMSRHSNHYVRHELFQGRSVSDKENRRFFPTKRAIRSHMYAASVRQQFSFIDQENVEATMMLPFPLATKKPRKRCCSFIRPRTSGTYLNAMAISCAYLTPRIKQRAMLCRCFLLQLKLTLITSQFVP